MSKQLAAVRKPSAPKKRSVDLLYSILIFLLGAFLGLAAKWLAGVNLSGGLWWQQILGFLSINTVLSRLPLWLLLALTVGVFSRSSLRGALNTFLLILGACLTYYGYAMTVDGLNPFRGSLPWYAMTLLAPLFGWLCWYAKGRGTISTVLSAVILAGMMVACFSFGLWVLDFHSLANILIYSGAVWVLYTNAKTNSICMTVAIVVTFLVGIFF